MSASACPCSVMESRPMKEIRERPLEANTDEPPIRFLELSWSSA